MLELLYPRHCTGCGKEGERLCPDCANTISIRALGACPGCGKASDSSFYCSGCRDLHHLDALWISASYENKLVAESIKNLKYGYAQELVGPLADLLVSLVEHVPASFITDATLVPVPLHRRRLLERGFNQSELLAQALSKKTGIRLSTRVLRRQKNTKAQAKLDRQERLTNLLGAFVVSEDVRDQKIILVDDVCSTGATMENCAQELKKAEAKMVIGLAIARGQ